MAASFAFLRDIRPYKTSWRIQVKVFHSWRQYTSMTGETLELVLVDAHGVKIHASVKKDLVSNFVNNLLLNEWRFIETFALNHASGQFRPTGHLYKMTFVTGTQCILLDVMGQVVDIGELETLEAKNKPTIKLDFELRDDTDERMSCTLWGAFAQSVFSACEFADGQMVICVLRFAKIKSYKGVRSFSNSFYASQVHINPDFPEVQAFVSRVPKFHMVTVKQDDDCKQYERKSIRDFLHSMEVRVVCTIYALDTDWSWYYFSCRNCNKKVTHIHAGVNTTSLKSSKPRFWCDVCKNGVTNVQAK
ncbi:putative protein [Arabidopsis thaliana]|uniref:Uncharacterized protein F18P9_140 n=1 Tax=Arabidopsis thaliana TaxID=3702 RepID=Q9M1K7_ARATH|nr:putative protein [Arabidopsis thaliana]